MSAAQISAKALLKVVFCLLIPQIIAPADSKSCSKPKPEQGTRLEQNETNVDADGRTFVSKDTSKLKYLLYPNYHNSRKVVEIKIHDRKSLTKSGFNVKYPVKILIHGFTQDSKEQFPVIVRDAYLKAASLRIGAGEKDGHVNVIVLDWGPLAIAEFLPALTFLLYGPIAENVRIVGKHLADFIGFLQSSLSLVHLVGFSLGAHVAGVTGYETFKRSRKKLGRITGLDPAGPAFDFIKGHEDRLDEGDAQFVDIIHTDIGTLGSKSESGTVDFYVNGGSKQPGCRNGDLISLITSVITACDHRRAPQYFALSIQRGKRINACACSSWQNFRSCKRGRECMTNPIRFGEYCPRNARGRLFMDLTI